MCKHCFILYTTLSPQVKWVEYLDIAEKKAFSNSGVWLSRCSSAPLFGWFSCLLNCSLSLSFSAQDSHVFCLTMAAAFEAIRGRLPPVEHKRIQVYLKEYLTNSWPATAGLSTSITRSWRILTINSHAESVALLRPEGPQMAVKR